MEKRPGLAHFLKNNRPLATDKFVSTGDKLVTHIPNAPDVTIAPKSFNNLHSWAHQFEAIKFGLKFLIHSFFEVRLHVWTTSKGYAV